jgi:hypothetical protein
MRYRRPVTDSHSFLASHLFGLPRHASKPISDTLKQLRIFIGIAASALDRCESKINCSVAHPSRSAIKLPLRVKEDTQPIGAPFDGQRCSHPEQAIPLTQSTGLYTMSLAQNPMSYRHSWRTMSVMPRKTTQVSICRKFNNQFAYR